MDNSRKAEITIHTLVNTFGFSEARSRQAVEAIGDKSNVEMAYNWLLDHGEEDKGGAVTFKDCPHLDDHHDPLASPQSLTFDNKCLDGCDGGENWMCLHCGQVRCSRYVSSHAFAHYRETVAHAEGSLTVEQASRGEQAGYGHFVAISLADLSVWCYVCEAYVTHNSLGPLISRLQSLKFGEAAPTENQTETSSSSFVAGYEMHGWRGLAQWPLPKRVVECDVDARPNYHTKKAHEYLDEPEVLQDKVKMVAEMVRASKLCVAYTGAGISTAAGVSDYATQAPNSLAKTKSKSNSKLSPLDARPTLAHRVLVTMHEQGYLKHWIQQNHDGLPQKAGYPQECINEIHGAWFDPSNPVVPMSGSLRQDLLTDLFDWEDKTDLCIALGSSLCGMNADRMVDSPARRARKGNGFGVVIVSLQQTQYDALASVRIFAKIDDVMRLLAQQLDLPLPTSDSVYFPLSVPEADLNSNVFHNLPYDENGKLDRSCQMSLDLRVGSKIRLINQPTWDSNTLGNTGVVVKVTDEGHFVIDIGGAQRRLFGCWWLEAAVLGKVPFLPLVNST
eukprot:c20072_g1_i1.p1 GENE.c20072_g1_i1~~c20072_g1_i1.p1  ORF type:complete len:560 (+),score=127.86 c20072_g1_i1:127-1806(+)